MEAATPVRMFPLEPIGLFVRGQKMTSEMGGHIRYWAHHHLAKQYFQDHKLLSPEQFDSVDWQSIHSTLHTLPWLLNCGQQNTYWELRG
jgi:hypothetical protein